MGMNRVTATRCDWLSSVFIEGERRHMGDWWFRQKNLSEFVATTD